MALQSLAVELEETMIFQYDNHADHISSNLLHFYNNGEFFDVVLKTGIDDVKIRAHRIVLCATSEFFLRTCRHLHNIQGKAEIQLENVEGTSLRLIINSLYMGSIQLNIDSVYGILSVAKMIEIDSLAKACCDFISERLNPSNCLGVARYAEQHGFTTLYGLARTFALKNFGKVYSEMEFLQLTESQLKQFLTSDGVTEVSQETVFHSLVAWVGHDTKNREELTFSLLRFIKYKLLDYNFILTNMESVLKSNECTELIQSWIEWHLQPPIQKLYCMEIKLVIGDMKIHAYNPELNKWSEEKWPKPAFERNLFGLGVIKNLVIIAGGGYGSQTTARVQCLDLETMKWTELPEMILARDNPKIIELNDNLYVVGGVHNGIVTRSIEKFDFASRNWKECGTLPVSLSLPCVKCVALNGLLYVYSDCSLECYDPFSNVWTKKPFMNEKSEEPHIAAVNGYLYAVGGETIERYDPLSNSWSLVRRFSENTFPELCVRLNNRLITISQYSKMSNVIFSEYNPECNEWKYLGPLGLDSTYFGYYFFSV